MTHVWVLKGGLGGWLRSGYPTEPVEAPGGIRRGAAATAMSSPRER